LEFGSTWCPYCQALAPKLAKLLRGYPGIRHVKVEDGPGRPLGRSFRVKLWPNLVFLRGGQVVKQLARPDVEEVREGLEAIAGAE
jgi:thioredoxin 1